MKFPKLKVYRPKIAVTTTEKVVQLKKWTLKCLGLSQADPRMKRVILVCRIGCKPEAMVTLWASGRISCTGETPECRKDSNWCYHRETVKFGKLVTQEEITQHEHVTCDSNSDSRKNATITLPNALSERLHTRRDGELPSKSVVSPKRVAVSPRKLVFRR